MSEVRNTRKSRIVEQIADAIAELVSGGDTSPSKSEIVSSIVNGDGVTVPADDYRLFPRNGRWYNEIRLRENATAISAWGFITDGEIAVTGKWGFTLAVPDEIREATTYWAAWLLKRYHAALQDASANFDLGQVVYSEGIPKPVINMLPGYRMMVG